MVQRVVALLSAVVVLLEAEAERLATGLRRLLVTGALVALGAGRRSRRPTVAPRPLRKRRPR